jgi:uncharacterized protein
MRYKINDIGEAGLEVDLPLTARWLAEHCPELEGSLGSAGLQLTGRIERSGEDFLLRGTLRGSFSMNCVRCLEPTEVPIEVTLAVVFVERPEGERDDAAAPETDDEADTVSFADGVIDLAQEIREEIFLSVPMSPRCEPECLGICAHCGGNRDRNPCDCEERARAAESPFAALAKLRS